MTDTNHSGSVLDSLIKQGKADPISAEEKRLARLLLERYVQKYGTYKDPVTGRIVTAETLGLPTKKSARKKSGWWPWHRHVR